MLALLTTVQLAAVVALTATRLFVRVKLGRNTPLAMDAAHLVLGGLSIVTLGVLVFGGFAGSLAGSQHGFFAFITLLAAATFGWIDALWPRGTLESRETRTNLLVPRPMLGLQLGLEALTLVLVVLALTMGW